MARRNTSGKRYNIDFDSVYLVPMSRIENSETTEEVVECRIMEGPGGSISCLKEGYRTKRFYGEYFEYLLYSGYVKKRKS